MTFEEWWKDKNNNLEMFIRGIFPNKYMDNARLVAKRFSEMAWEAAQPKWTLCKDGLPDNDSWVLVYMPETEDFEAMICTAYYTSGDWQSEWDTNQHPISAWMPLPEAPGNIDK